MSSARSRTMRHCVSAGAILSLALTACDRTAPTAPPEVDGPAAPQAGPAGPPPLLIGGLSTPAPSLGPSLDAPGMAGGAAATAAQDPATTPMLAWQDPEGNRVVWQMNGTQWEGSYNALQMVAPEWRIVDAGDFNGDGHADLLWSNPSSGQSAIWLMNGSEWTGQFATLASVPVQWQLAAAGDFTGNGGADLLWENVATGDRVIWIMSGTNWTGTFVSLGHVPAEWRVAGTGDFNGNGQTDIVWHNATTGQGVIWLMNGSSWTGQFTSLPTVAAEWRIAGAGDFSGDGKPDLVWQNVSTGARAIWIMNGTAWEGQYAMLPQVPPSWQIGAVMKRQQPSAPVSVQPDLRNIVTTDTQQNSHVCALRPDGTVLCWGDNSFGQLGIGESSVPFSTTPVQAAVGHTFIGLSSGINHKCGLKSSGEVWCWGNNVQGQLGAGTGPNQYAPVRVSGAHVFVDIDSKGNTTCAVNAQGEAYCWGNNNRGQLGTGNVTDSHVPVKVNTEVAFAAIATGSTSACALTPQGQAYCWGWNQFGILGNGIASNTNVLTPQPVATAVRFTAIQNYGGSRICGLAANGRAYCWGYSPDTDSGGAPVAQVPGGHTYLSLGAGGAPAGLTVNGTLYEWGTSATVVAQGMSFKEVSTKGGHASCGITMDGAAYCWGGVHRGTLGNAEWDGTEWPVQVASAGTFNNVVSGFEFSCAVAVNGTGYCWGRNSQGQLGRGFTSAMEHTPAPVSGGLEFDTIAAGPRHACGLTTAGAAWCWGSNEQVQPAPTAVPGGHVFRSIHPGASHTCAITTANDVYCWGFNGSGQFGNGTTAQGEQPLTLAAGGIKFQALATANAHTCGIGVDGITRCWGRNLEGAVGDGTFTNRLSPVPVAGTQQFVGVYVGTNTVYSCGITAAGEAYCWGRNPFGMLGDGTFDNRNVPTAVLGGGTYAMIGAGQNTTCGVRTDGSTRCWGPNGAGQYGAGTIHGSNPVPAPAYTGLSLRSVAVGDGFSCGLTTAGAIHCAGNRQYGQLGDGMVVPTYSVPVLVHGGHTYRR
jgi:alpha-tubulin suppressor-like RCC1 family protein